MQQDDPAPVSNVRKSTGLVKITKFVGQKIVTAKMYVHQCLPIMLQGSSYTTAIRSLRLLKEIGIQVIKLYSSDLAMCDFSFFFQETYSVAVFS